MLQAQSNGPRVSVSVVIVDFPDYCGPRLLIDEVEAGTHPTLVAAAVWGSLPCVCVG
jgi:hypothetical protein